MLTSPCALIHHSHGTTSPPVDVERNKMQRQEGELQGAHLDGVISRRGADVTLCHAPTAAAAAPADEFLRTATAATTHHLHFPTISLPARS